MKTIAEAEQFRRDLAALRRAISRARLVASREERFERTGTDVRAHNRRRPRTQALHR